MAKIKGPRKVHSYGTAFRVRAVQLSQLPGVQVKDVAAALEIHPFLLSKWRKQYRDGILIPTDEIELDSKTNAELKRLRELEQEYAILKEEHTLLKKAIRFCSERKQKSSPSSNGTDKNTTSR
jgi:transposase